MPIPAPGADEDATPIYGIRKPKASRKAMYIHQSIARIGDDVEAALQAFGLPPVAPSGSVVAFNDAARDAHWGTPANATARRTLQDLGATTVRPDKGWTERYYAGLTDGGANAGGAVVAGWYPISGSLPFGSLKRSPNPWSFPNNSQAVLGDLVTDVQAGVTVGSTLGRMTIVTPGLYEVGCGVIFLVNPSGARLLFINKNSTSYNVNPLSAASLPGSASAQTGIQAKAIVPLVAGDVVRFFAYQNSGGALAITGDGVTIGDAGGSFAYARYLGPAR